MPIGNCITHLESVLVQEIPIYQSKTKNILRMDTVGLSFPTGMGGGVAFNFSMQCFGCGSSAVTVT